MTNAETVVLITGASSGMGKETAIALAKAGYTVYGAARRAETMAELEAHGGHALAIDVTNETSMKLAVRSIEAKHGAIDVLVNNAGFAVYGAVEDVTLADARQQFEVNLFGLARLTQLVLPAMRKKGSGRIINISSMGGKIYFPLGAWYHASKHALEGWSDSLRLEVAPFGIKVIIIEPGIIKTGFGDAMLGPMRARAKGSPYEAMTEAFARATEKSYTGSNFSPPSVVAETIKQAIASSHPKTRYAVGKLALPLILARKFLGDRIFDKIIVASTK